jgi:3,4-dihydroxy 2-butanone 4-phosphate synthase/GTP cyclohydrolase II
LKIGTITDLIQYRIQNEKTVERISECKLPTEYGEFRLYAYQDQVSNKLHLALTIGDIIDDNSPVLVRVHARNLLGDLFASKRKDCGMPLRLAMEKIADEKRGVLVVIRQEEDSKSLVERIHRYQMEDNGIEHSNQREGNFDWRTTGTGAQILADLGVHKMRVLGEERNYVGLSGYNLEIVEYVSCTSSRAVKLAVSE